jgi:predicted  nucleic acid-binding Zn-ribbon protein
MKDDLDLLLELSTLEKRAYDLRKANKDLPVQIEELEGKISAAEGKLQEVNSLIEASEKEVQQNQTFIEDETKALEDSKNRLENISTNKEYDAIHAEIATRKRNIEDAKANTLHFQQVLENIKEDKGEVEKECNEVKEAKTPILAELKEELGQLEGKINQVVEQSNTPRSKIAKKVISVYDRIVQRRSSPYVISILGPNQNVCGICNRTQPPQKINETSKMRSLQMCETCGSLLVWKEEVEITETSTEEA